MLKLYISFVFLGAVLAYPQENNTPETFNELPCLSMGGICVTAGECPEGLLSKVPGLCPLQQQQQVECCHGISKSEKRCRYRGGECMPKSYRCGDVLVYSEANDCEPDEKCCILVK